MSSTRPRVLLVAHHANPTWTSEPLIGWRWATTLQETCDVTLLTHVRNREAIEDSKALENNVHYVDTESLAARIQRFNDRAFPSNGSVNRLLLETVSQLAFDRQACRVTRKLGDHLDVICRHLPQQRAQKLAPPGRDRSGNPC